jgi:N-acetylmuramoyl-L-alanine amidase
MFSTKLKNKFVLFLCLIFLFFNPGCGDKNDTGSENGDTSVPSHTVTENVNGRLQPVQNSSGPTGGEFDIHQDKAQTGNGSIEYNANKDTGAGDRGNEGAREADPGEKLKGITICIDAGHQAKPNFEKEPIAPGNSQLKIKDPGGTSGVVTKVPEHSLNLKVSKKLKVMLEGLGAKVVMTRERSDVNLGNVERAGIANNSNAHLFIRIHADGSENSGAKGMTILIPGKKYIKDQKILDQSKKAAQKLMNGLTNATGAKSRGITERDDMTGFNWAKVPMVLIEMGFMTNPEEDKLMQTDEYQDKIVRGITQGLIDYFEK